MNKSTPIYVLFNVLCGLFLSALALAAASKINDPVLIIATILVCSWVTVLCVTWEKPRK